MSYSKVNVPVAGHGKSKLSLPADHVTTMDFMIAQPCYYRHAIHGEHQVIPALATVRPAPMAVPTYGRMRLNMRAFFVPFTLVFPQYRAFHLDTLASGNTASSLVTGSPYFQNNEVVAYFTNSAMATPVTPPAAYDFISNSTYYKFTQRGRRDFKTYTALGYKVNWQTKDNEPISMLGLMCFAKVFIDWYANSNYLDSSDVLTCQQLFAYNDPVTTKHLSSVEFGALLGATFTCVYDNDEYFNAAWDNPVAPSANQHSLFEFRDPTLSGSADGNILLSQRPYNGSSGNSFTNSYGTPHLHYDNIGGSNYPDVASFGSQYMHDALRRLNNFQKRHQLVGARVIDRALVDNGFISQRDRLDRSVYIGGHSFDINVGDIYSTSDNAYGTNNPSTLGDYAGRGFGQGSKAWEFDPDEDGLTVVIASILPSGGFYQGMDRNNLHLQKLDFFNENFDALSVQPIYKREVYVSDSDAFDPVSLDGGTKSDYNGIFGFTGLYGEYKRPISWASGDIVCPATFAGGDSYHLFRKFTDASFNNNINNMVHSRNFTLGLDNANYNRIFNDTTSDADKFIVDFHFDTVVYAPCRPLFMTYDFDEDGHETKSIDIGGTHLN